MFRGDFLEMHSIYAFLSWPLIKGNNKIETKSWGVKELKGGKLEQERTWKMFLTKSAIYFWEDLNNSNLEFIVL